jgi:hypothetical protein
VRYRLSPWLVLALLAGLCAAVVFGVAQYRSRNYSMARLLPRLPTDNAVVVYADFAALRRADLLEAFPGPLAEREPEYHAFAQATGFNYLRDLDSVLASFHSSGTYLLLRGRFDWGTLSQYVRDQGGLCYNSSCRLNGSTPDRKISCFPLQPDLLALALGPDASAADTLKTSQSGSRLEVPSGPVWSLIPAVAFEDNSRLPAGLHMFARALQGTQRIVLSAAPDGPGMRLQLDATSGAAESAAALTGQLRAATILLGQLIARENLAPSPRDLSGVLAGGAFEQQGRRVLGHWRLERAFLESLGAGVL